MRLLRNTINLGVAAAAALVASSSEAAPCAGFADLEESSGFCTDVQWMRNRTITTGCLPVPNFCPNDSVTRLQMALFLRRLGNSLTTRLDGSIFGGGLLSIGSVHDGVCEQPIFDVNYPQVAHGIATFNARTTHTAADIFVQFLESTDDGDNYVEAGPRQAMTIGVADYRTLVVLLPPRELVPSQAPNVVARYRYALRVGRVPGSAGNADIANWECNVLFAVDNRNPVAQPLDE